MTDVYERLRERLDMFPQGFPKTESRIEIKILKHLFTQEEAEIALSLRPVPEPVSTVAERMGRDEKALGEILLSMSRKGLILRFRASEEEVYYFLAPWVVGIWEFQLNNLNPENAEWFGKYHEEGTVPERRRTKTSAFRVLPVEQEIRNSSEIEPYEKVSEIIESSTKFAVADCICRKEKQILGQGCGRLMEGCLVFDVAADYYVENGLAREISKEEARQVLRRAEEDGLVHHSSNHQGQKIFICNCCACCCMAMSHVVKYGNPHGIAMSNYSAQVDEKACTACETCIDRCQFGAISVEQEVSVIDRSRCKGCGLCVSTCPAEALSMVRKSPEEQLPVFASDAEMLQSMAKDKGKAYPFD